MSLGDRAHRLARRPQLERRGLSGATIRRKPAALASLFVYLLECNALAGGNPVHEVRRQKKPTRARLRHWGNVRQDPARGAGS